MSGTLAYGYSFESTQRELSNEYQHDRVSMLFKNICVLVHWTEVVLALGGLREVLCSHCVFVVAKVVGEYIAQMQLG